MVKKLTENNKEVEAVAEGQVFRKQPMILEGIRIADLTVMGAGPVATRHLADLGAEDIKIELPGKGDVGRNTFNFDPVARNFFGGRKPPGNYPDNLPGPMGVHDSRNKMSITIDLNKEKGQEIFHRLVAKSDVFTTNLRMAGLKRFGADYDTLKKYNPKLIYVRGSVYGPKGPDANRPGFAPAGTARSGFMTVHSEYDVTHMPLLPSTSAVDDIHALAMAYGVLAALIARDRLGIGQEVNLSMLSAVINGVMGPQFFQQLYWGERAPQPDRKKHPNPLSSQISFKCKDNKWIIPIAGPSTLEEWHRLCVALGKPELENDPRFKDEASREKNCEVLIAIFDEVFLTKTQAEWDAIFRQSGPDAFAVVNEVKDVVNDPQILANNYLWEVEHPVYGKLRCPGHPVNFTRTPATYRSFSPVLGQHTDAVLTGLLGYSQDEVDKFRNEGIV